MKHPGTLLAWLLLPLWLLKRALLVWRRRRTREPDRWFDEVDPLLVVGGIPSFPGDVEGLEKLGVRAVLSLCAEYLDDAAALERRGMSTHRIPVHDDFAVSPANLLEAVRWIEERVARGEKVYVHCAAGRGRSVAVVCAWLVRRDGISTDEALARIRRVRRVAGPPWQLRAVRAIEGKISPS